MSDYLDRSMDRAVWQHGEHEAQGDAEAQQTTSHPATAGNSAVTEAQAAAARLRDLLAEGSRFRATGATDPGGAPTWRTAASDSGLQPSADAGSSVHPGASQAVLSALQSLRLRLRATETERDDLRRQLDGAQQRINEVSAAGTRKAPF
jgi:hypothetical protein